MKKRIFSILAVAAIAAMVMVGCKTEPDNDPDPVVTPPQVTITFDLDGGSSTASTAAVTINKGGTLGARLPANNTMSRNNDVFAGWKLNTATGAAVTGTTVFNENAKVVATWTITGPQTVITFDLNIPDGYTGTRPTDIPNRTIAQGDPIGNLPMIGSDNKLEGYNLKNWYTAATGGVLVTATSTFGQVTTVTIYAQWDEVTETSIEITFNHNYGANSPDFSSQPFDILVTIEPGVIPEAKRPIDPTRTNYRFTGWWEFNTMGGTHYNLAEDEFATAITVYAGWESTLAEEVPPSTIDLTGVEKVTSSNGLYPIYIFELPAGGKWEDYTGKIRADVMVGPSQLTKTLGSYRLMGNYSDKDFTLGTVTHEDVANTGKGLAIAPSGNGKDSNVNKNGPFIIDQNAAYSNGARTVSAFLTEIGLDPTEWVWNTLERDTNSTTPHADFDTNNRPGPSDTGPFYFGIGLPGQGDGNLITSYVKNVRLVANAGGTDLVGKPLVFKKDNSGMTYPAFMGYTTFAAGGNGVNASYRVNASDGSALPWTADVTPEEIEITADLNYTGAPEAEKFTIFKGEGLGDEFFEEIPTGHPDDKAFVEWNMKADGTGAKVTANTPFTAATTIYAKWGAQVTVTLNKNDGSTGDSAIHQTYTIGSGGSLSNDELAAITRAGYTFKEWSKSETGTAGDKVTDVTTFPTDTVIYAIWIENVTITRDLNYSGAPTSETFSIGKGLAIGASNIPTPAARTGWLFLGWFTKDGTETDKGDKVTATSTFDATSTIYAQWSDQPVLVWQTNITSATDLNGSGEYIGQYGIKRDSGATEIKFGVLDGNSFTVTRLADDGYKQFCVQVGTAAGGSNYWCNDGFIAATGKKYKITFMASVENGKTGQLRFGPNNNAGNWPNTITCDVLPDTEDEDYDPNEVDPPTVFSVDWTQATGNLKIDTGNTAKDVAITITDIKIYEYPAE